MEFVAGIVVLVFFGILCFQLIRAADNAQSLTERNAQAEEAEASEMDNLVDDLINDFEGNPINNASNQSTSPPLTPETKMSDSELLRKIAKHSEESAFVLKRFLFVAQVFAALWFIGMIIQFIQTAN